MSFEDFLRNPGDTGLAEPPSGALATPQGPVAPAPPAALASDPFEAFLRRSKADQDQQTLTAAKTTTAANADQSASTAAAAAPVARQIGMPQAAVETDLPRYQAQAKLERNASLLDSNPVLAKWVAANPDSARVAQDEYENLSTIEKMWQETKNLGYGTIQSLSNSYNASALAMNRLIAPNNLAPWLFQAPEAQDWWERNMIAPREEAAKTLGTEDKGIGAAVGRFVGGFGGVMSQVLTTGGQANAVEATAGVLSTIANAARTAVQSMWLPSATAAINTGHEVMQVTGDAGQAAKAAAMTYGFNTLQGAVPFSVPGGAVARLGTGFVAGVATSEGQRAAMNLVLPEAMQKEFDPQEALAQGAQSAFLALLMGPRADPNYNAAIRRTYTDAANAEIAQRDIGKVAALGQIAAQSKLREADPAAFRNFVETVTDRTNLDAVYVDPKVLSEALAQSKVDITATMPEVAKQLGEVGAPDVRIPVAEFAAHIAGTDLEKPLLQNLKASPDGMTYKEGQEFYQKAAEEMKTRAADMIKTQQAGEEQQADSLKVRQNVEDQLVAIGRDPGEARTNATLVQSFYDTMANRLGMKASELFEKMPLRIGSGGMDAGFDQPTPTLALVRESWAAAGIDNYVSERNGVIDLSKIAVPKGERGAGVGTAAMQELARYADATGQRIELSPSTDFGATSRGRLVNFYKRFGFVENKGRSKDFTTMAGMYRDPTIRDAGELSQDARGAFYPASKTIALLKGADLSTFVHETGHFFLDSLHSIASGPDAPAELKSDFDTVLKWFGVKDAQTWGAMSLDQQRESHEKFARGFEAYLFEGKAPSVELQPIFARVRSWMVNVYRSLRGLNVELTPEVRGVFDRLLASDTAIKEAEAQRQYAPLFKTAEEAGMTPVQFAEYQRIGQQATDHAMDEMQARSLRDMQWASNAKNRAIKDLQRQAEGKRTEIREQVAAEVDAMPVFQALDYLKKSAPGFKEKLDEWNANHAAAKSQASSAIEQARAEASQSMAAWDAANPEPKKQSASERKAELVEARKRSAILETIKGCIA